MTRQVCYVFFGQSRTGVSPAHSVGQDVTGKSDSHDYSHPTKGQAGRLPYVTPHESPAVMTWPLIILAPFAVLLGFLCTTLCPWVAGWHSCRSGEVALFAGTWFHVLRCKMNVAAGIGA